MDAQDIIELIEYFRNLQDNEMKFEIEELRGYIDIRFEELYDKLTEYIDFNDYIKIVGVQIRYKITQGNVLGSLKFAPKYFGAFFVILELKG